MQRSGLKALLAVLLVLSAYAAGFRNGKYSDWIAGSEPPMPIVTIDGKSIEVFRGSYTWSEKPGLFAWHGKSVAVDMIAPEEMIRLKNIKASLVSPDAAINSTFPKEAKGALREFHISRRDNQPGIGQYSSTIPKETGTYIYHIDTEWGGDQGTASYFFVVEVR
jgi:hypothetical protein